MTTKDSIKIRATNLSTGAVMILCAHPENWRAAVLEITEERWNIPRDKIELTEIKEDAA